MIALPSFAPLHIDFHCKWSLHKKNVTHNSGWFIVFQFIIYQLEKQYGIICALQILLHIKCLDEEKWGDEEIIHYQKFKVYFVTNGGPHLQPSREVWITCIKKKQKQHTDLIQYVTVRLLLAQKWKEASNWFCVFTFFCVHTFVDTGRRININSDITTDQAEINRIWL